MFIEMSKEEILQLEKQHIAVCVSRFSKLDSAKLFYSNKLDFFTGYTEAKENLTHAFATPIKIFKIKRLSDTDSVSLLK